MFVLSEKDYKLFESLARLPQKSLKRVLFDWLSKKYDNICSTAEYIYAVGDIPIALVAHLDTVFEHPPKDIYFDRVKGVVWSPTGLGADDRAGVFAILKIIKDGYKPTVIFTTDEEIGAVGATQLVTDIQEPLSELKYIIQLDRRGTNDCVFYDCENPEFVEYVESFDFVENFGSFSDISVLCPFWKVAGVNLSIGYEDEHSVIEVLHTAPMLDTIKKVEKMLAEKEIPAFEYIEGNWAYKYNWGRYSTFKRQDWWMDEDYDDIDIVQCNKCKKYFKIYEAIPVLSKDGKQTHYYCPDCCSEGIDWCVQCNQAYEINPKAPSTICPACIVKANKRGKKKEKKENA